MINVHARVSTSANSQVAAILAVIFAIVHRTKPIFELVQEFDERNPYMKELRALRGILFPK